MRYRTLATYGRVLHLSRYWRPWILQRNEPWVLHCSMGTTTQCQGIGRTRHLGTGYLQQKLEGVDIGEHKVGIRGAVEATECILWVPPYPSEIDRDHYWYERCQTRGMIQWRAFITKVDKGPGAARGKS